MIPASTYRLQLHQGFTFDDAREVASYLRDLGVTHVYCSPYLQATRGSTHGYDVVDHDRVNEELGGVDGHAEFTEELVRLGLGQILDVVPNHMAVGERNNEWWWDVLENGPSSRYAQVFDVEWEPPEARLHNMVLLPVLGDHYGRILEKGELRLAREGGRFVVCYYDKVFPVAPKSLPELLTRAALLADNEELAFLADTLRNLPAPTATDALSVSRRHRDKEIVAQHIDELCSGEPRVAECIDRVLSELNHDHDALDRVLSQQNYRLAFWRTAGRDLGYRRFFDINTLVGLRMEDDRVFQATHGLIFQWLASGVLDGVRIDHPDGLRDPQHYFERIHGAFPEAWIVAEKILEPGETLRDSWPIHGTTGYDFLQTVDSLFVDPAGEEPLTRIYQQFTGVKGRFHDIAREGKEQALRGMLGSDVNRLTAQFMSVCESHRRYRDYTRHQIHTALRVVITNLPVYRTYVRAEIGEVHQDDRRYLEEAISESKRTRPELPADLFDFLQSVLLCEVKGDAETEFLMRFQQFTGPAMAKGVEDTAFYIYNRLTSLNEVGGDPERFGITLSEFHQKMTEAAARWPHSMLSTSTHDTKRSEDVRCRIHLLSEMPDEWSDHLAEWASHNERHRSGEFPDRNMEYLLYQATVGAWPITPERLAKYMEKASREAKTHTSWTDPNPDYDESLQRFVHAVTSDSVFMSSAENFVRMLVRPGRINSMAMALIKLTCPGVPDTYQGSELWDLSLVDPDNRRPVDYELRKRLLQEVGGCTPEQILERDDEGLPKLWVIHQALLQRRAGRIEGSYIPIAAQGNKAHYAVAFLRGERALTLAPRLASTPGGDWQETAITVPEGYWKNVLTGDSVPGGEHRIADLLHRFPVALLVRD